MEVKKISGYIFKYAFSALLLYYLFNKVDLNFSELLNQISTIQFLNLIFILFIVQFFLMFRLQNLLKLTNIFVPFKNIFKLHFIGMFFNSVLPGSVGGELVKGFYIRKSQKEKNSKPIQAVIFDKIFGLYGLLVICFFAILINSQELTKTLELYFLSKVVLFSFLVSTFLLIAINSNWFYSYLKSKNLLKFAFVSDLVDQVRVFKKKRKDLIYNLAMTLIAQILHFYLYYLILDFTGFGDISAAVLFYICSVGMIATAIPIAPAGIGVGQAVYFYLFERLALMPGKAGVVSVSILQMITIFWSLLGVIIFVLDKEVTKKQILDQAVKK